MSDDAQEHFKAGSLANMREDWDAAIIAYEAALKIGLPPQDEMQLRMFLSECYAHVAQREFVKPQPDLPEIIRGLAFRASLSNAEAAVAMDVKNSYGYFAEPLNRARLDKVDWCYGLEALEIKEKLGLPAALPYLEAKTALFAGLSSTPLIRATHVLGDIYREAGRREEAKRCWEAIVAAAPVSNSAAEAKSRATARENLSSGEGSKAGGPCFIATAVYGSVEAREVTLFRHFRDEVLLCSSVGRSLIAGYYRVGPHAARVLACSPSLRRFARLILDVLARLLGRTAGPSSGKQRDDG